MALPTRSPTFAEVLALWSDRTARQVHVCLPVVVQSYDATHQTVSVKPQLQEQWLDQDGTTQTEVLQVISGVPVQFPRGGKMRMTFPITQGDTGIVVMSDRSLDLWLQGQTPVDTAPPDARRHHLADAIYIPGVNVTGQSWAAADASVITIGDDTQAGEFVATANRVLNQLNSIVNWLPTHTHVAGTLTAGETAVTGVSGIPVQPAPSVSAPASATVKVLG